MSVLPATPPSPRWLYLHGFASGPQSKKGLALAEHYARRGLHLERLDLRQPSLERLTLSAMMHTVREALGGARDRAVVFGSSLGGLTACRLAEEDARVCALVLLAPALQAGTQLRHAFGEERARQWERSGWLETLDYTERRPTRVHAEFLRDLDADEARSPWPDVRVPTLLIHGRQDTTLSIGTSRDWARGKRHVRLVEVEDGHELVDSLPRILAEADDFLRPFLGSAPDAAPQVQESQG